MTHVVIKNRGCFISKKRQTYAQKERETERLRRRVRSCQLSSRTTSLLHALRSAREVIGDIQDEGEGAPPCPALLSQAHTVVAVPFRPRCRTRRRSHRRSRRHGV